MRVAVLADDPISADGAVAALRGRAEVELLPDTRRAQADVLLVLTHRVDEDTLDVMRRHSEDCTATAGAATRPRVVLVTDAIEERHLFRAISHGLVSILSRRETGTDRLVRALLAAVAGRAEMPGGVLHELVDQVRSVQRDVLKPNGLTPGGLQIREVEVLRLLAEGLDTVEIADRLSYSERTIKNVIHGMMSRLNLRNRSHAVAFGMRCGAF